MNLKLLKDNLFFNIFFLICMLTLLSCIALCSKANAKCVLHTVEKGDTLAKISKAYTGTTKHWKEIKLQNKIKTKWLKVGQKIEVYVPDDSDWEFACTTIIKTRLNQLNLERPKEFVEGIVHGVSMASDNSLNLSPREKVEFCRLALTTAIQESYCQFAIGSVGELGIYQFRAETTRVVIDEYNLFPKIDKTDRFITKILLDNNIATMLFILHFSYLRDRYGSLWNVWYRYNGIGEHAKIYADRALVKYSKIKKIKPMDCKWQKIQKDQLKTALD